MENRIGVKPLPYKTRQRTFGLLILVFLVSLPFLYLYATGYRFDFTKPTNLISTGGMYVAVDKTGAEIYIDGSLVRQTRAFRHAFYAQNLDVGTHRVHVQKPGYHTWVKELPVSEHLVTEAEAFNFPLVPQVRVISPWQTATGTMVVRTSIINASTTNLIFATTTLATTTLIRNDEYRLLVAHFSTSSTSTAKETTAQRIKELLTNDATTTRATDAQATTTIFSGGVKLYESGDDVYATWVGPFEQMPYYYCAPSFPAYVPATTSKAIFSTDVATVKAIQTPEDDLIIHPVQTIPKDVQCDPSIRVDRRGEHIEHFEFLPGSTDLVLLVLGDGIYAVEIDDRAWQNVQPLVLGSNLHMHVENGNIFVYDGSLIYQVILAST